MQNKKCCRSYCKLFHNFNRDLYEVIISEVICVQEPHRQTLGTQLISNLFKVSIDQKTDIHLYAVPASVPFYLALDFKHSAILKNCDPMCKSKYLTTEHMVREYPGKPKPINTRSRALLETNEVVTCSSASTCASSIERNVDTSSSAGDSASAAFGIADILLDTAIFELDKGTGIIGLANLSKSLQSVRKRKVDVIACTLDIDAQIKAFIIAKEKVSVICYECTEAEEMNKTIITIQAKSVQTYFTACDFNILMTSLYCGGTMLCINSFNSFRIYSGTSGTSSSAERSR
jgi:hypothetical protein